MKQVELELLHGYLNGNLSDPDFAKLQSLLRNSAEARRTLRGLATVDAKLQAVGASNTRTTELLAMPAAEPARTRSRWTLFGWGSVATAACVALILAGLFLTHPRPSRPPPDVAAAVHSTQEAIARLSFEPSASLPAWASPTASLLDQPRFPQSSGAATKD